MTTPGLDESQFCAEAVDEGATGPGGEERVLPEIDSCLIVEWEFDVGEEAGNNAFMDARDAVTADGEQVEPLTTRADPAALFLELIEGTVRRLQATLGTAIGRRSGLPDNERSHCHQTDRWV